MWERLGGRSGEIVNLANIYLFKVTNKNTRKRCGIYSKLTIKTIERRPRQDIISCYVL